MIGRYQPPPDKPVIRPPYQPNVTLRYVANQLDCVIHNQEKIMSALTDLQAAVTAIQSAVSAAVAEIQSLAGQISSANNDPAVEAAAQAIQTAATNLQASVNSATPPAPPSP